MTALAASVAALRPAAARHLAAAAEKSSSWNSHDTRLALVTVAGIALIVVLISVVKLHPFLALTFGSLAVAIASGVSLVGAWKNFETGVGGTLQEVGLLIALGAMLGRLLADSGGADRIVDTLVGRSSRALVPWAIALVAMIVGLPMFFEIGLVLLLPVIVLVARRSDLPLMRVAIPALAGLSALHGLIPPHPGPLIAIGALNANLGVTLGLGILVAIPTVVIAGPLFSLLAARWVPVEAPASAGGVDVEHAEGVSGSDRRAHDDVADERTAERDTPRRPSFGVTLATILFPVVLMLARAVGDIVMNGEHNAGKAFLDFIGEPLVALFLAVLLAMVTFGYALGAGSTTVTDRISNSLGPVAGIILIVGAGGGFKGTLTGAGVGDTMAKVANHSGLSLLVISYVLAVLIRLATGSATVATTTAAGIIGPIATGLGGTHLALLALAIGAGSVFLSHVNDAGFWLVNQMFRLTVGQTFKTWSVMETLLSLVAFGWVSLIWAVT
ncbi:MAG: GntT/GntP/DsdX family permease [Jatrophihabitans sp.]|uniref:GntT/GntP/DsdX family permease n=1 Tax=Jatrophihabitans sp. TaxID=1932789 RepID=UPI003F7EF008